MNYGMSVYDNSGMAIWDTNGILGRVIGVATITFALNEYSTKSVTIPNLISTDKISVMTSNNSFVVFLVSRSGTSVSITRTNALSGATSTHYIWAFRIQ